MDKIIILIALIVGIAIGFVVGTSVAISSIDNTIQAIQEECHDKHPVYKGEFS